MDELMRTSVLPAEGVRFEVACSTGPGSKATRHEASLSADWEFTTPHDLDLERIGVALGGSLTCVTLADQDLPAARGWLEHAHRTRPADIVAVGSRQWAALTPALGCPCETETWATPAEAAHHVRNLLHWARAEGTTPVRVAKTAHLIGQGASDSNLVPRSATDGLLTDPDATDRLWEAGIPFALVPELCRELSPTGIPIPTHILIAHLYAPREWDVLEKFVPFGPVVLGWAAQHRTPRDARRPHERLAWVEAGVPLKAIERVFTGMAYDLVHARAYAAETGVALGEAATVLGRWQESGTTPEVRDLVDLHRHDPHAALSPRCAPARPAVERTVGLAARRGLAVDTVTAALALARTGTAPDAAALLAASLRPTISLRDPDAKGRP